MLMNGIQFLSYCIYYIVHKREEVKQIKYIHNKVVRKNILDD